MRPTPRRPAQTTIRNDQHDGSNAARETPRRRYGPGVTDVHRTERFDQPRAMKGALLGDFREESKDESRVREADEKTAAMGLAPRETV